MAGFVRVTLLRPHGEEHEDLNLRFGQESVVPMTNSIEQDPSTYVVAYKGSENNARPIEYTLNYHDESRRDVLVPEECAKLYFGDWTIPKVQQTFRAGAMTFGREKNRVALKWGDYMYRTPDRGQEFTSDIISAPKVPHVKIQRVDQGGRVVGAWEFEPWAWFEWDKDINPRAVAIQKAKDAEYEMKPSGAQGFDLSALSPAQVEQLRSMLLPQTKAKAS